MNVFKIQLERLVVGWATTQYNKIVKQTTLVDVDIMLFVFRVEMG